MQLQTEGAWPGATAAEPALRAELVTEIPRSWHRQIADCDDTESDWWSSVLLPWQALCAECAAPGVEYRYLAVIAGERLMGLAVIHIVENFNAAQQLPQPARRWLAKVQRVLPRLLCFRFAFVQPAIIDGDSFWLRPGLSTSRRAQLWDCALGGLERLSCHAICAFDRNLNAAMAEAAEGRRWLKMAHLERSLIRRDETGPTGEDWAQALPTRHRQKVRANRRKFAKHNGQIVQVEPAAYAQAASELFDRTRRKAEQAGGPVGPVHLRRAHLEAMSSHLGAHGELSIVQFGSELSTVCLAFRTPHRFSLQLVGRDESVVPDARAYFNLMYAQIDRATELGAVDINLGYTSADTKRRVGAESRETRFFVFLKHWSLAPIAQLAGRGRR